MPHIRTVCRNSSSSSSSSSSSNGETGIELNLIFLPERTNQAGQEFCGMGSLAKMYKETKWFYF
jgi:hypothetical protein